MGHALHLRVPTSFKNQTWIKNSVFSRLSRFNAEVISTTPNMYNGFLHKIVRNTGRICICFFCQTRQQEKAGTPCVYCTPTNLADVGSIPPPHPAPLLARKNPCFIHILKKYIFSIIIVYHDGKNMNADCACIQQNIKQKYLLYRFCKTVQWVENY